jgi:hypothetical protein
LTFSGLCSADINILYFCVDIKLDLFLNKREETLKY